MVDVRGDVLRPPHGTTPAAVKSNKNQKHHLGRGKAALGFGADQIKHLVSMATDSSHRVIIGKRAPSRFLGCF